MSGVTEREGRHTPTPWAIGADGEIYSPSDYTSVAMVLLNEDGPANAEFIVRACNAHDDLVAALRTIITLDVREYEFPADWSEQIAACPECERYKGHPIQQGICDTHRRPLWDREKHDRFEREALAIRMKDIARAALTKAGAS